MENFDVEKWLADNDERMRRESVDNNIPYLINAVKELREEIDTLKKEMKYYIVKHIGECIALGVD